MNMQMGNGTGSIVKLSGNRRKPYAVKVTTGWEDGKQRKIDTKKWSEEGRKHSIYLF